MEQVLGTCLERGIKVVANAGGLNPTGCADALREIRRRHGDLVVEPDEEISRL